MNEALAHFYPDIYLDIYPDILPIFIRYYLDIYPDIYLDIYPDISMGIKTEIRHSFRLGQNDFAFLFYRSDVAINVPLKTDASSSGLSETDEKVLAILQESGLVSQEEIARQCGKTTRTIQRSIVKLAKLQKLRRIGSKKVGYWEVIE
jgi:hypothetical protein